MSKEQPTAEGTAAPGPLDAVATVLLTAITTTASALTLMGVNSDRTWLLLDEDKSRGPLVFATVSAVIAVAVAMTSYFLRRRVGIKSVLLWVGVVAYLLALVVAVRGAAGAADVGGRPSLVDIAVTGSGGERIVTLEVAGSFMDNDERLGVRLTDLDTGNILVNSFPRPTGGQVALKTTLPVGTKTRHLEAMVWAVEREDRRAPRCARSGIPDRKPHGSGADHIWADCAVLAVPGSR